MAKLDDWLQFHKIMSELEKDREPKRRSWRRAESPFDALDEIQETADRWKQFIENFQKLNKKEEKKGWEALTFAQKLTLMTAIVPFIVVMQLTIPAIILIKVLGLHQ